MARLPATPATLRCRILATNQNAPYNNVVYLQYTGAAPSSADCATIGNAVLSAYGVGFTNCLNTLVHWQECEVTDLTSDTSSQGVGTTGGNGTEVNAADQPLSAAVALSFIINRHYRGGHPRIYLPFSSSVHLGGGRLITEPFITVLRTGVQNFHTALNAITVGALSVKHCAVSYYDQKTLRPAGVPFPIVGTSVHDRLDSQRRRLGKETG